ERDPGRPALWEVGRQRLRLTAPERHRHPSAARLASVVPAPHAAAPRPHTPPVPPPPPRARPAGATSPASTPTGSSETRRRSEPSTFVIQACQEPLSFDTNARWSAALPLHEGKPV